LFLPDLVDAHVEKLNLQPAETKHDALFAPPHLNEIHGNQPAYALCG